MKRIGRMQVGIGDSSIAIERVVDNLVEKRRIDIDTVADVDRAQEIDASAQCHRQDRFAVANRRASDAVGAIAKFHDAR